MESPKKTTICCDKPLFRLEDFFYSRWPLKALRLINFPLTVLRNLFLAECRVFNLPILFNPTNSMILFILYSIKKDVNKAHRDCLHLF